MVLQYFFRVVYLFKVYRLVITKCIVVLLYEYMSAVESNSLDHEIPRQIWLVISRRTYLKKYNRLMKIPYSFLLYSYSKAHRKVVAFLATKGDRERWHNCMVKLFFSHAQETLLSADSMPKQRPASTVPVCHRAAVGNSNLLVCRTCSIG